MERIRTQRDAEPIGLAFDIIPARIRPLVEHARFVAGVDPLFVGLHDTTTTTDGRSYRTTPHACFPWHMAHRPLDERVSTVALPRPVEPWIVVHELAHVLHEALDFDTHTPVPVTEYATRDAWEAFAEAFTAWLCPDVYVDAQPILMSDEQTLALFESLAVGT